MPINHRKEMGIKMCFPFPFKNLKNSALLNNFGTTLFGPRRLILLPNLTFTLSSYVLQHPHMLYVLIHIIV